MSGSVSGSIVINEDELAEFVRSEIDSSDFGSMMTDAASEAMSDWDLDEMQSSIQKLDSSFDRHDDRLDDLERSVNELMESGTSPSTDEDMITRSFEVDAALKKQHQRISELEHAVLCLFEYLHDLTQRDLARGIKRFNDSLQGGE
tara:strand:+ start:218 stop:655 length:438 start_codon:yes stop_codon:yes gene_type:complete